MACVRGAGVSVSSFFDKWTLMESGGMWDVPSCGRMSQPVAVGKSDCYCGMCEWSALGRTGEGVRQRDTLLNNCGGGVDVWGLASPPRPSGRS